jgi:hypothetical protein
MSKPKPADLPSSMAILGVLIEDPNKTVAEVAAELGKRFARCGWDPSTAYNALPQMARSGQGRPRVRCTHRTSGEGGRKAQDRYEPTSEGVLVFRDWMTAPITGAPVLREALYGRIELCHLEDLPNLITMAREEAKIAQVLYSKAASKLKQHIDQEREEKERKKLGDEPTEEDYLHEARNILLHITPGFWAARHAHNAEITKLLTGVAKKAGLPMPPEPGKR